MTDNARSRPAVIIPTLRYKDASSAVDWLCRAFEFKKHLVVPGKEDTIAHAQLTFGNGMIMLGSAREDEFGKLQAPNTTEHGPVSQSPYIIVEDVDAHCAQAEAAGAEVVMRPKNEDYGGRFYSCRDPEGNLWNFGTYNPWLAED